MASGNKQCWRALVTCCKHPQILVSLHQREEHTGEHKDRQAQLGPNIRRVRRAFQKRFRDDVLHAGAATDDEADGKHDQSHLLRKTGDLGRCRPAEGALGCIVQPHVPAAVFPPVVPGQGSVSEPPDERYQGDV
eukprot:scaffold681216_cov34-Prasinocladus_malaysianus.AAC.1